MVKKRRITKEIKAAIVDNGVKRSDVAYMAKNLITKNKQELVEIVQRDDIPIVVQVFAHSLLQDLKHGNSSQTMGMVSWAFDHTETNVAEKVMSEEEVDAEIQLLLTKQEL